MERTPIDSYKAQNSPRHERSNRSARIGHDTSDATGSRGLGLTYGDISAWREKGECVGAKREALAQSTAGTEFFKDAKVRDGLAEGG